MAVDGDEHAVCEAQLGRWSSLLPVGTVVRRPSVKLVQLIVQAIHESPHRVLRITHVYAALQLDHKPLRRNGGRPAVGYRERWFKQCDKVEWQ